MRFGQAFRFMTLLALLLGMSGAAIAEDGASEEDGKAPVESAPPADQDEATPDEGEEAEEKESE